MDKKRKLGNSEVGCFSGQNHGIHIHVVHLSFNDLVTFNFHCAYDSFFTLLTDGS